METFPTWRQEAIHHFTHGKLQQTWSPNQTVVSSIVLVKMTATAIRMNV